MKRCRAPTLLLACLLAAGPVSAQEALTAHPGYVDFARFGSFSDDDLKVEINISGPILKMVAASMEGEDDEFSRLVSGLRSIRVNIFSVDAAHAASMAQKVRGTVSDLKRQGWEAVVRIRDGEEINILVRPGETSMVGLVAVFIDPEESAGFVNIVGDLDPAQIARIGRQFDIDLLRDVEVPTPGGDTGEEP